MPILTMLGRTPAKLVEPAVYVRLLHETRTKTLIRIRAVASEEANYYTGL